MGPGDEAGAYREKGMLDANGRNSPYTVPQFIHTRTVHLPRATSESRATSEVPATWTEREYEANAVAVCPER